MMQLAQVNIGRLVAPMDDPRIAGFVAQLDEVNALADGSPGFVWRLQSEQGNAMELGWDGDPLMIANLSVWESVEALQGFVYRSQHVRVLRDRAQWFEKPREPYACLWWVPAGHRPTLAEARERLDLFRRLGATRDAFSFAGLYAADGGCSPKGEPEPYNEEDPS